MKTSLMAALALAAAQAPPPPPTGTANPGVLSPRPPPIVSPEVTPDRRVTFRLRQPNATEVLVRGLFFQDRVAMQRNAQGIWTATVGPVEPGLYEYSFSVDGLSILDPNNPLIEPTPVPEHSIFEVPGQPPLLTELQDVPHGTVHVHHYQARSLEGRSRRLHVYTPPGYERGKGERLPVLVLLHGAGGTDATWSDYGRAPFIFDNLIARRKIRPMIIVMPNGHPRWPPSVGRGSDNTPAFAEELLTDVLPLVDSQYWARTDAAGRAIAGLSMGGRQALTVGLNHPDRFGWVAGMGASLPQAIASALVDGIDVKRKPRWLWIGCGAEDPGYQRNRQFAARLQEKGIAVKWHSSAGGHRWPVWRSYLVEIAPQLFNAAAVARSAP